MINFSRIVILYLILYSVSAFAGGKMYSSQNISELLHLLRENDFSLKKSSLNTEQAYYQKREALGALLPSIDMYYNGRQIDRKKENKVLYDDGAVELKITQKLLDVGAWKNNSKAKLGLRKSEIQQNIVYTEKIYNLAISLIKILELEQTKKIYKEQVAFLWEQERKIRAFVTAQKVLPIEHERVITDLQKVEIQIQLATNQISYETSRVQNMTGKKFSLDSMMSKNFTQPLESNDPSYWFDVFIESSDELRLAETNTQLAAIGLSQSRSGYYPQLDLYGSAKSFSTTVTEEKQSTEEYILGVQFSINLYKGGSTQAGIHKSSAFLESAQVEKENLIKEKSIAIERSVLQIKANYLLIGANQNLQQVEKEILRGAQVSFENKNISNLDLLDSQKNYFEARLNYITSTLQQANEFLLLYKEAGVLDDAKFVAVFRYLLG